MPSEVVAEADCRSSAPWAAHRLESSKTATVLPRAQMVGGKFQSPCGEVVMKANQIDLVYGDQVRRFQSPRGEVVMKGFALLCGSGSGFQN